MSVHTKARKPEAKGMPSAVPTGPSPQCTPWAMAPPKGNFPQSQPKSMKSLSLLFCSFYKLYRCTVGNSGFLANNHRVNTTLQIENKMPQTSSNACLANSKHQENTECLSILKRFENLDNFDTVMGWPGYLWLLPVNHWQSLEHFERLQYNHNQIL
jgi:hypothetical protein